MDLRCLLTSPELINIHTAFHAGAHQQVLDFDTSSFSFSNALPVRVLKARSQIALGQAQAVSSELASEKTPDLVAVKLLADLEQGKDVTSAARKLTEQHGQENLTVQIIGGIILERAGETDEALALLSKHQGSLDAYVALRCSSHLADRVQGCSYNSDPPPAKSHRSCRKGGSTRQKMGTRQLARQHR
jgi:coatomer protein complex subunit epsilon